jgi:hypothetical protein
METIQQPWLGAYIAIGNSSYVYESANMSSHKNPKFMRESQGMCEMRVKDPKSGGILRVRSYRGQCQYFNQSNNLGYELLLQMAIHPMSMLASTPSKNIHFNKYPTCLSKTRNINTSYNQMKVI